MLDKLEDAIYSKFVNASSLTTAFPPWTGGGGTIPVGLYNDLALEGAPFPYVVWHEIASPSTLKYGGIQRSEADIQFAVYGNGRSATRALMATLTSVFDDLILTLASGHNVNTMRMGEPIASLDSRDASGIEVWGFVVVYRFVIAP